MDNEEDRMEKARELEMKYFDEIENDEKAGKIKQEMRELLTQEEFEEFFPAERIPRILGEEWMKKLNARPDGGDVHLIMAGLLPATDEERIELMQKVLNFSEQKARELVNKSNARRPEIYNIDAETHWKIFGDLPATDEERVYLMQKFWHFSEKDAKSLLEDFKNTPQHVENILSGKWR